MHDKSGMKYIFWIILLVELQKWKRYCANTPINIKSNVILENEVKLEVNLKNILQKIILEYKSVSKGQA